LRRYKEFVRLTISGIFFAILQIDVTYVDMEIHEKYMHEAFKEAKKAEQKDEVPIGAVVVCQGQIIARAHNMSETLNDPTAHAEMQAITAATAYLGGKYLNDCTLYVTLEPCPMCAGALYWSQLGTLVYGVDDPKRGYSSISKHLLHPKTKVTKGILESDTGDLIKKFFVNKRKR
jgi:tRNA(adenine34) deaminase